MIGTLCFWTLLGVGCRLSQVSWRTSDLLQWAFQRLLFIALGLEHVAWDRLPLDARKKRPLNGFIFSVALLLSQQTFFF